MRWLAFITVVACTPQPPPSSSGGPRTPKRQPPPPSPSSPSTEAAAPGDACTRDADCVVTNFAGCCACPQCSVGAPTARSLAELARAQDQCKVMRCNTTVCDLAGACPPGEAADRFAPVCRAGTCAGVRR
ncbi:MAG: hypothetical protein KF773_29940 [Deltaproteobacteria bacterium]|nr:hypothetical protein [Deltaproteobacteria bacterium]